MKKKITTVLVVLSISTIASVFFGVISGITHLAKEKVTVKPLKSKEKIVALLVEEYNENSKFYNMKVVDEKDNNKLQSLTVRDIIKDSSGDIWIATEKGISEFIKI